MKKCMEIDQRRRQKLVLERQKAARKEKIDFARRLCEPEEESNAGPVAEADKENSLQHDGEEMADEQTTTRRSRRSRKSLDAEEDVWRNQVMMPDWMIAVPEGLASQWLVTPRPQG